MSFEKKKIPGTIPYNPDLLQRIREKYRAIQERNFFAALVLGAVGILALSGIGVFALSAIPSLDFSASRVLPLFTFGVSTETTVPMKEKVNILLAGMGGGVHDGAELTDTIMLASINFRTHTVSLLSIPRDLYVKLSKGNTGKINEVYLNGFKKGWREGGIRDLMDKISQITGESIDYYGMIDFQGFIKAVNILGGVTVDIPEDLIDREYPKDNEQDGYTTFSVKKGRQILDGATALKYARSRHSTNDFDRSLRQHLILRAIRDQFFQTQTILNLSRIKSLYATMSDNVFTNISAPETLAFVSFFRNLPSDHILSFNLNDTCSGGGSSCERGGLLYIPARDLFNGMSVVLPSIATPAHIDAYTQISTYVNLAVNYPNLFLENREVYIVNATKNPGLANQFALMLKRYGFNVPERKSIFSDKTPRVKTEILYSFHDDTASGGLAQSGTTTSRSDSGISEGDSETNVADDSTIESTGSLSPQSTGMNSLPKFFPNTTLEALSLLIIAPQTRIDRPRYVKDRPEAIEIVLGDDAKNFLQ